MKIRGKNNSKNENESEIYKKKRVKNRCTNIIADLDCSIII